MPLTTDLAPLGKLIAATHGWPAAKAFKAYRLSEADGAQVSACAVELLRRWPDAPGAALDNQAVLAAALAVQAERRIAAPVQVVAGTLAVAGQAVLHDDAPWRDAQAWRGHVWVMMGPHIVDAGLLRRARAPQAPPALARHVHLAFGPKAGLYVDHWGRTQRQGLTYHPAYVLSAQEVTSLMGEAYRLIKGEG